ncbi:hypothetical protein D3C78_667890 [compost metagenome]
MPPRTIHRIVDRRERRYRTITPRVAQSTDQRAVAAHGVSADAALVRRREMGFNQCRQFLHNVVMHPIVSRPGFLGGIQIKPGAEAKVPGAIRITRHIRTARAGVRCDDDQPQLGGHAHGAGLLHEVLVGARQAGQPVQHRQLAALLRLRRQIDGEHHVAAEHVGAMAIALVPTAKTFLAGDVFQTHGNPPSCKPQA